MKFRFFLLIAFAIVQMHILTGFAQRDPSNEILVFSNEGVQREARNENDVSIMRSMVKSDGLRANLSRIGINEQMLEVANPTFREADTLTVLSDGTRLTQVNMTKLFRIRVPEGRSREELIDELNRLPEVAYAEPDVMISPLIVPDDIRFDEQYALQRIQVEDAWDIFNGNANSIIAIIDGGVDVNHYEN